MRRADRLFQIVQLLRREQATTAATLARELEVSERTVYRDVQDLVLSGIPIRGEAGVGYALPARFELPPLMFDAAEIQALVLGMRMVEGWSDAALARAARSALRKVEIVLPERRRAQVAATRLFVPDLHGGRSELAVLNPLREALEKRQVLRLGYADDDGKSTAREVRPLGLFYWGRTWTLAAWCELRAAFRTFRVDRIASTEVLARTFVEEGGRSLEDFLARMREEARSAIPRRETTQPPEDPDTRAAWRGFQKLGSVGPATANDLVLLGFRATAELSGRDPIELYDRICQITGERHDPCVEDAFRCAIAQADHPDLPTPWRRWHRWTPLRGKPAGTLPAELRELVRARGPARARRASRSDR